MPPRPSSRSSRVEHDGAFHAEVAQLALEPVAAGECVLQAVGRVEHDGAFHAEVA